MRRKQKKDVLIRKNQEKNYYRRQADKEALGKNKSSRSSDESEDDTNEKMSRNRIMWMKQNYETG